MSTKACRALSTSATKYKDNDVIGGQVAGTIMDTYKTQINTGLSLGVQQGAVKPPEQPDAGQ